MRITAVLYYKAWKLKILEEASGRSSRNINSKTLIWTIKFTMAYLFSPSKHCSCLDLQSLVSRRWSVSLSLSRPRSRSKSLSRLEGRSLRSAVTGASESSLREILPEPIRRVGISLWDSRWGLSVGESGCLDAVDTCWRPWQPVLKLLRWGDRIRPSCSSCWNNGGLPLEKVIQMCQWRTVAFPTFVLATHFG